MASEHHETIEHAVSHAEEALSAHGHAVSAVHDTAHAAHHEAHELPNWITLLNQHFPDSSAVHFLHKWENVIFSMTAALIIGSFFILAAKKQRLVPEGIQNACEAIVEAIEGFASGILGPEHGKKHVPYLGTVFLYILFMNWSGLVPFMKSPTAVWSTTLALGLFTMIYVQFTGMKEQGVIPYFKHMAGNPSNFFGYIMILIMLPLNIILEFGAVPFSLSLRLFANVSSEDRLLFKFAELNVMYNCIPIFFQLFANVLAVIFSLVQAFVFMLLTTVYISLVLPHGDHGHGDDEHGQDSPDHSSQKAAHAH